MHPDKSPGPDGMTPNFFQKGWSIVSQDVVGVVQRFFDSGVLVEGCGDANVVLIPKKKAPEFMSDFRPIALCNVIYKIITKVITNRMKGYMDSIVSGYQSAFITGHLIHDNVMLSFEIFHYLKRKRQGKVGYMALKLYMSKAYDRIEWKFLEAMLLKLGFEPFWMRLLQQCVTSAKYKVVHGGGEMGPIVPTRGWLHGCKVANGAPGISHMLFVNDSYLYCKANLEEAYRVKEDLGGMGFRNFRNFNLALLGKQGWRLLTHPNSLVARVFKARYFPNGSYLSAESSNNPSFVWRSVLEAQSLVAMGVRWCTSTGENISVLGEPWLEDHSNPRVIYDHPTLVNAKVANLMHVDGGGWDIELINDLFLERDRKLILVIPIHLSQTEDHLIWHKVVTGSYTARSAYNLLQESQGQWHNTEASSLWKSFWKLKVPPKAKNTVWRATMDCLPTTIMLRTKRVEVSAICPICHGDQETIVHTLITCQVVKECWNRVGIGTPYVTGQSFLEWCTTAFKGLKEEKRCVVIMVCWAMWGARNELVWNKKTVSVDNIVAFANKNLNAQNSFLESSWTLFKEGDRAECWSKPGTNNIKINVDAALFGEGQGFGIRAVAREDKGLLIEGVC
uniref:Reverse transcriptase n=1 Tax=Cannabis sativa TaxID=3483 RepID=A0A803PXL3_CANSA